MSGNSDDVVLRVVGLTKYFGAIKALENVSFDVRRGEILAIVGDNGAGKSTLLKILSGVLQPTSGEVYLDGRKVNFRDPQDAMRHGIAIAHQVLHEQLIDKRLVWENFFAGRELVKKMGPISILDKKTMKTHIRKLVEKFNLTINEDKKIGQLSGGQRRIMSVLRVISQSNARLMLFDEIYIGISPRMLQEIYFMINDVKSNSSAGIMVTAQKPEQLEDLAFDRLLVMRRGRLVGEFDANNVDLEKVYRMALGVI
ncbi:MAG: ATP-binding cassette domain-containing protein [Candidatus Bathyarchaeia archaeon]